VHRDVSPSNVLISSAGEVKLTDFGIARATSGRQRTATGIIKGKVPYMPPEYIEHGTFDRAATCSRWACCCTRCWAARVPSTATRILDTIRRIVAGQAPHLGTLAPAPRRSWCSASRHCWRAAGAALRLRRAVLDALPAIHTHRVRRRLGDLVRERLSARAPRRPIRPPTRCRAASRCPA
jgi:hypothetical protein